MDGKAYEAVTIAQDFRAPKMEQTEELCMVPLRAPLAASGFSANALRALRDQFPEFTASPVQSGAANAAALEEAKDAKIVPGAALTGRAVGAYALAAVCSLTCAGLVTAIRPRPVELHTAPLTFFLACPPVNTG